MTTILSILKIDHLMTKDIISNKKIKSLGWNIEENFDKGIDELIQIE